MRAHIFPLLVFFAVTALAIPPRRPPPCNENSSRSEAALEAVHKTNEAIKRYAENPKLIKEISSLDATQLVRNIVKYKITTGEIQLSRYHKYDCIPGLIYKLIRQITKKVEGDCTAESEALTSNIKHLESLVNSYEDLFTPGNMASCLKNFDTSHKAASETLLPSVYVNIAEILCELESKSVLRTQYTTHDEFYDELYGSGQTPVAEKSEMRWVNPIIDENEAQSVRKDRMAFLASGIPNLVRHAIQLYNSLAEEQRSKYTLDIERLSHKIEKYDGNRLERSNQHWLEAGETLIQIQARHEDHNRKELFDVLIARIERAEYDH